MPWTLCHAQVGIDVMTVQYRWPLGMPLVRNLGSALWEVRSASPTRIARTYFSSMKEIVLLHGFIKKTRKTPPEDRVLALQRKMRTSKPVKTRNEHRGSSFRNFLREDGMIEEGQTDIPLHRSSAK
jgi:phage-related protein